VPDRAQELGSFIYRGLILQLRSIGPGMLVDRWIREHCPDLREAQAQAMEAEITGNLAVLKPSTRANDPAALYEASVAMNAAYAIHGGDLLGRPYLAVPYRSQGYGEISARLIALALGSGTPGEGPTDRQIIDAWAQELGGGGGRAQLSSRKPASGWEQNCSMLSAFWSNRDAVAALLALPMARHTTLGGNPLADQAHMGGVREPFNQ